ncbi:hypothetical protein JWG44_17155 [Leptospira sp. 201903071]|uniref:hypothetical protein n=1 Tax=Leptospira ainazelensis TaxID=2810034 RepID=UPI001962435D|nr:hypothetical protein [Leptospira ainazelensis]MBM9501987.1 hypothetical protein [Leptospira ainazelensis]
MNYNLLSNVSMDIDYFLFLGIFIFLFLIERRVGVGRRIKGILFFLITLLIVIYLFGPNLKAQLWLIDDHETFFFLKSKTSPAAWSEFFDILINKTEVGKFGESPRYRISYYVLRIFESLLWKENVYAWYFFRCFTAGVFVFSILKLFSRFFSVSVSTLFVLSIFSVRYWSDIFSRLGAGEVYAVLGVALLLIAIAEYRLSEKKPISFYILISLGVIIAAGSKENFLILIFIPIVILFLERKKKDNRLGSVLLTLPILFSFVTVLSLFLFFRMSKVDIYGNSALASDRFSVFVRILSKDFLYVPLVLLGLLFSLFLFEFKKGRRIGFDKWICLAFLFLSILLINIVFYNGQWPTNSRYDFPGVIAFQGSILILIASVVWRVFRIGELGFQTRFFSLNLVLIFYLSSTVSIQGLTNLQRDSRANMKRTQEFTSFLKEFVSNDSNSHLIFYVHQAFDFEPVDSFSRFLNYYGDSKERMLIVTDVKAESDFKNGLLSYLRMIAKDGSLEKGILPYNSKSLLGKNCVVLLFPPASLQDAPKISDCKKVEVKLVPFQ